MPGSDGTTTERRWAAMVGSAGLRVNGSLTIPDAELSWRFSRSSGPGGQGVNTTDSRAELSWDVGASAVLTAGQRERILERLAGRLVGTTLTVAAQEHREQLRNRAAARDRMAATVAGALAPPPRTRRATKPTRGSKERRLTAKKQRSATKSLRSKKPRRDD
ncbi:alternative ribosome rescue aminoacyl-tRNA hydrolase ArfB [Paraoerskovia marina]|uniref:alternative ribosome rescue aminoacyl-tRNA hydrolase ArfB n=1 Tax=Paraoerskovia marina TaxID=545619 RepID=UPI00200B6518|nr:alternative ribosome rescue aminoacyl-tRNA hydrolase ArfB [Paraoerskovia marina]